MLILLICLVLRLLGQILKSTVYNKTTGIERNATISDTTTTYSAFATDTISGTVSNRITKAADTCAATVITLTILLSLLSLIVLAATEPLILMSVILIVIRVGSSTCSNSTADRTNININCKTINTKYSS